MHLQLAALSILALLPHVFGAFHMMTRYERAGLLDCSRKDLCICKYNVEWRMGAVPSNKYNCNSFKDDKYFQKLFLQNGSWTTTYPSICGSKQIQMYVTNGGNSLEVWESNGRLIVTCYKQHGNPISCGNNGDPVCLNGETTIYDDWVCADTPLCN